MTLEVYIYICPYFYICRKKLHPNPFWIYYPYTHLKYSCLCIHLFDGEMWLQRHENWAVTAPCKPGASQGPHLLRDSSAVPKVPCRVPLRVYPRPPECHPGLCLYCISTFYIRFYIIFFKKQSEAHDVYCK